MFFSSWIDALLPGTVHLLVLLLIAVVMALRRPPRSKGVRIALGALLAWTWIFSTPGIANHWLKHLEGEPHAQASPVRDGRTLIVVLASGEVSNRGGPLAARLDPPGMARLAAGVALWRHTGGRLAVVGGKGTPGLSLAHTMSMQAQNWGVPEEAIDKYEGSTRTYEDLQLLAPVARAHEGPAWLVTSAMHMPRAMAVAANLGLRLQPYPCDYRQFTRLNWVAWLPNAGAPALFAEVLHEEVGLLYYRLRRWAS